MLQWRSSTQGRRDQKHLVAERNRTIQLLPFAAKVSTFTPSKDHGQAAVDRTFSMPLSNCAADITWRPREDHNHDAVGNIDTMPEKRGVALVRGGV